METGGNNGAFHESLLLRGAAPLLSSPWKAQNRVLVPDLLKLNGKKMWRDWSEEKELWSALKSSGRMEVAGSVEYKGASST